MQRRLLKAPILLVVVLSLAVQPSSAQLPTRQPSGPNYTKIAIMNGNLVMTVFGNDAVIGQPCNGGPRGAWKNPNDGYLGDVSPFFGAEIDYHGEKIFDVETCPVNRPSADGLDQNPITGAWWTMQPENGFANPNQQSVALYTNPTTWPSYWPYVNDPNDPGWPGQWDGYFGKGISQADQETYFVMDDNGDLRFNFASNNIYGASFKPDSTDSTRNGLGFQVTVRALQWSNFIAQDNIFWIYNIANTSTTTYNRAVFGILVGTYVGITGCDDSPMEYDNDWSFYNASVNLTYTGNYPYNEMRDPLWVGPVGMVGYAFLESPGNPYDGIDNDGDADSSAIGQLAPQFTAADFDSTLLVAGQQIVLIDTNYNRTVYTIPDSPSVVLHTRGLYQRIYPGKTKVVEGNQVCVSTPGSIEDTCYINPNALDGVDNNFNGLIDENFYVHYHQLKESRTQPPVVLIDILRPLRHIDYIHNLGTSPYSMIDEKRNDGIDNNQDWIISTPKLVNDDVGRDGKSDGAYGYRDGLPTSGYIQDPTNPNKPIDTGEPGEPHIDKTDPRESDQIGLTSFYFFTPSNVITLANKLQLWEDLTPGYFDVPNTIVNNQPIGGEDGDFVYGSGYFPLLAGTQENFSVALVYGGTAISLSDDIAQVLKHKNTVQQIYNANYQFPQPPIKPTLTAVPGNGKVTLYWDRAAENTIDPVLHRNDFEGYKIYRSTLPNFADIFTVTDANGEDVGYTPLAQYDLIDSVQGYFEANPALFAEVSGYSYYLGSNTGLVHSYVDNSVNNGRRYFYAVCAYNTGDDSLNIFPSEDTKIVTIGTSGLITYMDRNVAVVTPNAPSAGYVPPSNGVLIDPKKIYGTGSVYEECIDASKVTGHTYKVTFLDTQVDSVNPVTNSYIVNPDSTTWDRQTTSYTVQDLTTFTSTFNSEDTIVVLLPHQNLIPSTVVVKNALHAVVDSSLYNLSTLYGTIRARHSGNLNSKLNFGPFTISYQYYPVYHSSNIQGSPFIVENKDADIFDGLELDFENDWNVMPIDSLSGFYGNITSAYAWSVLPLAITNATTGAPLNGYLNPCDYNIVFYDSVVGSSIADLNNLGVPAIPVNFKIFNITQQNKQIQFALHKVKPGNRITAGDNLAFYEQTPLGYYSYTWRVVFNGVEPNIDSVYNLVQGDTFKVRIYKPFHQGDSILFTPARSKTNIKLASQQLSQIRAVPNPYLTASQFELPLPPGITSGRGTRVMNFIHLPPNCTIKIFTARGELIRTLYHNTALEDGSESWNLRTDENLDIAFGVYFYVVESAAGTHSGKLAIMK
jgi:hypothetical protein